MDYIVNYIYILIYFFLIYFINMFLIVIKKFYFPFIFQIGFHKNFYIFSPFRIKKQKSNKILCRGRKNVWFAHILNDQMILMKVQLKSQSVMHSIRFGWHTSIFLLTFLVYLQIILVNLLLLIYLQEERIKMPNKTRLVKCVLYSSECWYFSTIISFSLTLFKKKRKKKNPALQFNFR